MLPSAVVFVAAFSLKVIDSKPLETINTEHNILPVWCIFLRFLRFYSFNIILL